MHERSVSVRLVLAVSALCVGCPRLEALSFGECGNFFIDPGEDCDALSDPTLDDRSRCNEPGEANACRYACTGIPSSDDACADGTSPPCCPRGWTCDVGRASDIEGSSSGTCRFARGSFRPTPESPIEIIADDGVVGDANGDGKMDLVGGRRSAIELRLGVGNGSFRAPFALDIDPAIGSRRAGDFDGDGRLDVVVPLEGGLFVAHGDSRGTLAPMASSSIDLDAVVASGASELRTTVLDVAGEASSILAVAFRLDDVFHVGLAPTHRSTAFSRLDSNAPLAGDIVPFSIRELSVEAFAIAFTGTSTVAIFEIDCDETCADATRATVRLRQVVDVGAVGRVHTEGVHVSDVDGDGRADLSIAVLRDDGPDVVVALERADGMFAAPRLDLRHRRSCSGLAPCTRRILTSSDLDGDGLADFVTDAGVLFASASSTTSLDAGFRRGPTPLRGAIWSAAAVGDFDGDGRGDFSAIEDGRREVAMFLYDGAGGFDASMVDVDAAPRAIAAADFDGDEIDDVAFIADGLDRVSATDVFVFYGGRGAMHPLRIARTERARAIDSGFFGAPSDPSKSDRIRDLVVEVERADDERKAPSTAVVFGSQRRRMLSLLAFGGGPNEAPRHVVVGKFDPSHPGDDLVAFGPSRVWMAAGTAIGEFPTASRIAKAAALDGPDECLAEIVVSDRLATVAGDLDRDGRDDIVVVARDASLGDAPSALHTIHVLRFIPRESGDGDITCARVEARAPSGDAIVEPSDLSLLDTNGDGWLDVVVSFAGRTGRSATSKLGVAWLLGTGDPREPFGHEARVLEIGSDDDADASIATVVVNADRDLNFEVVVATRAGFSIVDARPDGTLVVSREFDHALEWVGDAIALRAADVTGDRLPELLFGTRDGLWVYAAEEGTLGDEEVTP